MSTYSGKVLVAAPSLFDFFRRTMVLVIEHNEDGAFGIVLNRPSEMLVADVVPHLSDVADGGSAVHIGGPVGSDSVVVLGEYGDISEAAREVVGAVGIVDPENLGDSLERARVFAGHAGWAPGQLEREVADEAWLIMDADPEYVFHGEDLWSDALARRGGQWALLSTLPDDPSLN